MKGRTNTPCSCHQYRLGGKSLAVRYGYKSDQPLPLECNTQTKGIPQNAPGSFYEFIRHDLEALEVVLLYFRKELLVVVSGKETKDLTTDEPLSMKSRGEAVVLKSHTP